MDSTCVIFGPNIFRISVFVVPPGEIFGKLSVLSFVKERFYIHTEIIKEIQQIQFQLNCINSTKVNKAVEKSSCFSFRLVSSWAILASNFVNFNVKSFLTQKWILMQ